MKNERREKRNVNSVGKKHISSINGKVSKSIDTVFVNYRLGLMPFSTIT